MLYSPHNGTEFHTFRNCDRNVRHHLERARIAARVAVPGTLIAVKPVIEGVLRTMEKIHRARGVELGARYETDIRFHGEQQDLEEMIGNLVDNACKWAKARVEVAVFAADAGIGGRPFFRIAIEDDGPGLSHETGGDSRGRRPPGLSAPRPTTGRRGGRRPAPAVRPGGGRGRGPPW